MPTLGGGTGPGQRTTSRTERPNSPAGPGRRLRPWRRELLVARGADRRAGRPSRPRGAPLAGPLGLVALPAGFFAALVALVLAYLVLVEAAKALFYRRSARPAPTAGARSAHERHVRRRARRFVRDPSAPALPSPRR